MKAFVIKKRISRKTVLNDCFTAFLRFTGTTSKNLPDCDAKGRASGCTLHGGKAVPSTFNICGFPA